MARVKWRVDKAFLFSVITLMVAGLVVFYSASLGLLAKNSPEYSSVTFSQTVLGLCLGSLAMFITYKLDYRMWRKAAFFLLIIAIILNVLVLFQKIGFAHGGARRWLVIGGLSFQTSEVLKLAFVVYFSAWAAAMREKMQNFKEGFLALLALLAVSGVLLLKQPDTDTFLMIVAAGLAIFIVAGGKWKYVFTLMVIGVVGLGALAFTKPYVMQRISTFFHPESQSQGAGYQIQQSLIAIGSGGIFGKGFGQSVQKFDFLPEPMGDSIFAVGAEEFGFLGATLLILLFVFFAMRGLKIARASNDIFGRLLVVGLVIMIVAQAFVNIGAMLGVLPLSGITLPFVSHGGTSLFITLLEIGIILSVSKSGHTHN